MVTFTKSVYLKTHSLKQPKKKVKHQDSTFSCHSAVYRELMLQFLTIQRHENYPITKNANATTKCHIYIAIYSILHHNIKETMK